MKLDPLTSWLLVVMALLWALAGALKLIDWLTRGNR